MSTILSVESVSKRYRIHQNRAVTLKESMIRSVTGRHSIGASHWALRDVSFKVQQGQALGIIGHNGAGKSTLLRLLCGVGRPTRGQIQRGGHISGLLDLGSGFHPDMSGRENIMTGGLLSGLTRREVLDRQDEIIAFAELEEFIDEPVRTYSSGMYLRLAFATAMSFEPMALVIDEVLAVGDTRFRRKCIDRLAAFRADNKTLILTSHDPDQIRVLCDEVLVLEDGQVVMQGDPQNALLCYDDLMRQRTEKRATKIVNAAERPGLSTAQGYRQGTQEAMLSAVRLSNESYVPSDTIHAGGGLYIQLEYSLTRSMPDLAVLLGIYSEANVKCFETSIPSIRAEFGPPNDNGCLRCHLPELPLLPGHYYVNVGLFPTNWDYMYDYHWQMHSLYIGSTSQSSGGDTGVVQLRPTWSAEQ